MASLIYDSALFDLVTGAIDSDNDTFKVLLVTSTYVPNKGTHVKRSDITNESSGTGYTTGGAAVTCTVAKNTTTHAVTLTFSAASWPTSTITARGAVYYKSRGGASSADELIGYNDFTTDKTSGGGTFSVAASVLTINNP
jgi:hypothetical protein